MSMHAVSKKRAPKRHDPDSTRESILQAAREILARDGKEGLSVAQVAQRAGVNRGTAYQHFQTREQLIQATAAWVGEQMYSAVFGEPAGAGNPPVTGSGIEALTRHLAEFAMENPELVRVWLFELLSSDRPQKDPFWRQYKSNLEAFAKTEAAQPDLDAEAVAVITLSGLFLWPIWVRAHTRSSKARREMTERLTREVLRLSLHGTLRPEKYPDLEALVGKKKR